MPRAIPACSIFSRIRYTAEAEAEAAVDEEVASPALVSGDVGRATGERYANMNYRLMVIERI